MTTDDTNIFDRFCKTAPFPVLAFAVVVFALACGGIVCIIASFACPPPLDVASVSASAFSKYVVDEPAAIEPSMKNVDAASDVYRNLLDEQSQEIYDVIEYGARSRTLDIEMPGEPESSQAVAIAEAVLLDNPDIFWMKGTGFITSGSSHKVVMHPEYIDDVEDAEEMANEYDKIAADIIDQTRTPIINARSDNDTLIWIMIAVANMSSHGRNDADASSKQNINSVFSSGNSVCAGYAKSVCYIARRANIPCVVVHGEASGFFGQKGNHAWIAAYVDGQVRLYDPFWFDTDVPFIYAWRWAGCSADDGAFNSTHVNSTFQMGI